jgi:acetyl esterase
MPQQRRATQLDYDASMFLQFFNMLARRPVHAYTLSQLRHLWGLLALALGDQVPLSAIKIHVIEGLGGPIDLRIYVPREQPGLLPVFVWCHGGGFLVGDLDAADAMCRRIARNADAIVVAVRYRLLPEHDLYAGRADIMTAIDWITREGDRFGIDSSRIAVGGDSAGGNIAAAVAQECVRRGSPRISMQVLAYPATRPGTEHPSKAENAHGYLLTAEIIDWIETVIGPTIDLQDPWLSPGSSSILHGLPPALIITAGFDPIRDDGLEFASRLREAAVPGLSQRQVRRPGRFHFAGVIVDQAAPPK